MANFTTGHSQQVWVASQTDISTVPGSTSVDPFVAADAIKVLETKLEGAPDILELDDEKDNSLTANETIDTRINATVSMSYRKRHAGTSSGVPDDSLLVANVIGSGVAGGTAYKYRPKKNETHLAIFTADAENNNQTLMAIGVTGQVYRERSDGTGPVEADFEGDAREIIITGRTTFPNGATAAQTTAIAVGDASVLMVGSFVSVASTSEMLKVTAVSVSGNTISATRGYGASTAATISSGDGANPWKPSATTYGSGGLVPSGLGSVSLRGSTVTVQSYEVEVAANKTLNNDSYGSKKADSVASTEKRTVTYKFDGRKERALYDVLIGARQSDEKIAVQIVAGSTAGTDLHQWDSATCKLMSDGMDDSGREVGKFSLELKAKSSTDNGEVTYDQK